MSQIAVIGMGCWYPGARDVRQLWENVLARRQQFRKIPDVRLPLAEYYSADPQEADKTYSKNAAVIDGFIFDWATRRVPRSTFESSDIVHWLALEVALSAVADAGYTTKTIPSERSAVILGNTLTGEFTRANAMRLRWPYVRRSLRAASQAKGLDAATQRVLEQTMEVYFKSVFAPITEDTLAGALSNTIAGRIANFLNLDGGNYTVDGACSSSLIAISTAAQGLESGDLDLAIAGGVDVSLDTFELIGFSKVGALSKGDMNVYDRRGQGFIPGEGCGFVVLKRLEDARRDGNQVYAVVRGWGISSDGKGGITAPNSVGQSKALLRAYQRAGYKASSVDFIEGHGTGTRVGDKTELEGVVAAVTVDGPVAPRTVGMTSFKSIVGHTKAAAGVGGFIKAVCAVNRRIVPPTAGCQEPHPIFEDAAKSLFPVMRGVVHHPDRVIRAGVSAMGFGGINCHVTLESGDVPNSRLAPSIDEHALSTYCPATEVYVLDAASLAALRVSIAELVQKLDGAAVGEAADISGYLTQRLSGGRIRLAIVTTPDQLVEKLNAVDRIIQEGKVEEGAWFVGPKQDIWLSNDAPKKRLGFVFPGQGSQRLDMALSLVDRFPAVRSLLRRFDDGAPDNQNIAKTMFGAASTTREALSLAEHALAQTEVAQPSIAFASLAWLQVLTRLGVVPHVVAGHSLGELAAAYAAGACNEQQLIALVRLRGLAMAAPGDSAGAMASLACDRVQAERLIASQDGYVVVANENARNQTVISGERAAVSRVAELAKASEIGCKVLPVSNAFHSQLVSSASEKIKSANGLIGAASKTRCPMILGSGSLLVDGADLRDYFSQQILAKVNFVAVAEALKERAELIIEVGPGRVLCGLLSDGAGPKALPVESRPGADSDFNVVIAALFTSGQNLQWNELFGGRLVRPFIPANERIFITNPCELPFPGDLSLPQESISTHAPARDLGLLSGEELAEELSKIADALRVGGARAAGSGASAAKTTIVPALPLVSPATRPEVQQASAIGLQQGTQLAQLLVERVATRTGFSPDGISMDMRLIDDLNMDSIKASEVIGAIARQAGVPSLDPSGLGNATLAEVVDAIERALQNGSSIAATPPTKAAPTSQEILFSLVSKKTGFPLESIDADLTLLDDLNLDSIKAAELVSAAARDAGVNGGIDPSSFANATLGQLAAAIDQAARKVKQTPAEVRPVGAALDVVFEEYGRLTSFARGTYSAATKPCDLADFDIEKLERLLAAVAERLEVATAFDLDAMASCSLGRFGRIFDAMVAQQRGSAAPELGPSWVRSFSFAMEPKERARRSATWTPRHTDRWSEANVLILADAADLNETAEPIRDAIIARGGRAKIAVYENDNCAEQVAKTEYSVIVSVMPRVPQQLGLLQVIERVRMAALCPPAAAAPRRWTTVAYLQTCDGAFGRRAGIQHIAQTSLMSFAASLHHERPDLRVRVVDMAANISVSSMCDQFLEELMTSAPFEAVGYDAKMVRAVPRATLVHPEDLAPRPALTSEDVVFVTGGAKGITAECAIALAQQTGATMLLVGSSPAQGSGNEEISRTMERFKTLNLSARYYSCDISNRDAVRALVGLAETQVGRITAVIHGAGINKPRRLAQVEASAALTEISPKLAGMQALVEQFAQHDLKLFAAMTSVIGVTGMPGNGWYAFSNEAVDLLLRKYKKEHANTEICSLSYSVWDEVGMGAKLGSVKGLSKLGIGAIPRQDGVERFLTHINHRHTDSQAVITARLGGLDTWIPAQHTVPKQRRFQDNRIVFFPGVEAVTRSHLTLTDDPYLVDHLYNGSYLFPTVFGLEAMAQTVGVALCREDFSNVVLEDIKLERPIVVDPDHGTTIEIRALVRPGKNRKNDRVDVGIYTESTGFSRPHFEATFSFDGMEENREIRARAISAVAVDTGLRDPHVATSLEPRVDLYGGLLFQGELFQRIDNVARLSANFTVIQTRNQLAESFVLGDPYCRDTLLQSGQLIVPQYTCLPVGIERWRIDVRQQNVAKNAVCFLDSKVDKLLSGSVHVVAGGTITEVIEGYKMRVLGERPENPTADALARSGSRKADSADTHGRSGGVEP